MKAAFSSDSEGLRLLTEWIDVVRQSLTRQAIGGAANHLKLVTYDHPAATISKCQVSGIRIHAVIAGDRRTVRHHQVAGLSAALNRCSDVCLTVLEEDLLDLYSLSGNVEHIIIVGDTNIGTGAVNLRRGHFHHSDSDRDGSPLSATLDFVVVHIDSLDVLLLELDGERVHCIGPIVVLHILCAKICEVEVLFSLDQATGYNRATRIADRESGTQLESVYFRITMLYFRGKAGCDDCCGLRTAVRTDNELCSSLLERVLVTGRLPIDHTVGRTDDYFERIEDWSAETAIDVELEFASVLVEVVIAGYRLSVDHLQAVALAAASDRRGNELSSSVKDLLRARLAWLGDVVTLSSHL